MKIKYAQKQEVKALSPDSCVAGRVYREVGGVDLWYCASVPGSDIKILSNLSSGRAMLLSSALRLLCGMEHPRFREIETELTVLG